MYHIVFNHPLVEEDLGCFHLLAIVSFSLDGNKVGLRDVLYPVTVKSSVELG